MEVKNQQIPGVVFHGLAYALVFEGDPDVAKGSIESALRPESEGAQ